MPRRPRFRLSLERLELAAGHDGLLRGAPEPCLLIGLFQLRAEGPALIGRCLHEVGTIHAPLPLAMTVGQELLDLPLPRSGDTLPGMALISLLLEKDSGADIARLYTDLGTPARLAVVQEALAVPDTLPLGELLRLPATAPPHAEPIQLLYEERAVADEVRRDDWVGAALIRIDPPQGRASHEWQIRARSADRRNDWTLWLHGRLDAG